MAHSEEEKGRLASARLIESTQSVDFFRITIISYFHIQIDQKICRMIFKMTKTVCYKFSSEILDCHL